MKTLVAALVCLELAVALQSEPPKRTITLERAKSLVLTSLTPEQKKLPSLGAEQYQDPHSSRFLFFAVTWGAKSNQSVVVGNYAVDPYTGAVFSAVIECTEENNPQLQELQARIRSSLKLSRSEYLRLKTKGPLCTESFHSCAHNR